jgi:hypothetical protein
MNFSLLDYHGRHHELRRANAQVVVLYFTGFRCPMAKQGVPKLKKLEAAYRSKGVAVWLVNATPQDDPNDTMVAAIGQLGAEGKLDRFVPKSAENADTLNRIGAMSSLADTMPRNLLLGDPANLRRQVLRSVMGPLTVLRDDKQLVAHYFGVTRTCETIAIDTKNSRVIYRGALDDQAVPGAQKPAPTENYLADALDAFLAGKPIATPTSQAHGCLITFADELEAKQVSYREKIAPLLQAKCVNCHSPGNIGPFALASHQDVKDWSAMIREVVMDRRMPPWDADPAFGKFTNDCSLSPEESRTLARWIELGCPHDGGDDPLAAPTTPPGKWALGKPDFVVPLPERQEIPATGTLDYRYIDSEFAMPHDAWLRAAVCRPENPAVVHHIIVRVKYPKGYTDIPQEAYLFTTWAPGVPQAECPKDTGVFLPKGARFRFEMHYTTNGEPQTDQSAMGLYLAAAPPKMRLEVRACETRDLEIPPGEPNAQHLASYCFKRDAIVFDVGPHMHLRGKWFKFQLLYPNGRRETLLSVPRYDFNWQTGHRLAEPKRVPAGTWMLCTGAFDNSKSNPHNPDPNRQVEWGLQTWDEMFMGFITVADLPREQ